MELVPVIGLYLHSIELKKRYKDILFLHYDVSKMTDWNKYLYLYLYYIFRSPYPEHLFVLVGGSSNIHNLSIMIGLYLQVLLYE